MLVSDVGGLASNAICLFRYEIVSMHQRDSNKKVSRPCPFPSIHLMLEYQNRYLGQNKHVNEILVKFDFVIQTFRH